jgi:hypothetical protein
MEFFFTIDCRAFYCWGLENIYEINFPHIPTFILTPPQNNFFPILFIYHLSSKLILHKSTLIKCRIFKKYFKIKWVFEILISKYYSNQKILSKLSGFLKNFFTQNYIYIYITL